MASKTANVAESLVADGRHRIGDDHRREARLAEGPVADRLHLVADDHLAVVEDETLLRLAGSAAGEGGTEHAHVGWDGVYAHVRANLTL